MTSKDAALFIDLENLHYTQKDNPGGGFIRLDKFTQFLKSKYNLRVRRVYFDPGKSEFAGYRDAILDEGLEPVVCFETRGITGKNSADIMMVIDIMETSQLSELKRIIIASGDGDFVPLIRKLNSVGIDTVVVGFGKTTSKYLRRNCSEFIDLDIVLQGKLPKPETSPSARTQSTAGSSTRAGSRDSSAESGVKYVSGDESLDLEDALDLMEHVMASHRQELLAGMKPSEIREAVMRLDPSFNEERYGYPTFLDLLKDIPQIFDVQSGTNGDTMVYLPDSAPGYDVEDRILTQTSRGHSQIRALLNSFGWQLHSRDDRLKIYEEQFELSDPRHGLDSARQIRPMLRQQMMWEGGLGQKAWDLASVAWKARVYRDPMNSVQLQSWIKSGGDMLRHVERFALCLTRYYQREKFDLDQTLDYLEVPREEIADYETQAEDYVTFFNSIGIYNVKSVVSSWR
jgi:uncharacterized LabA/DUF88 family protein